MVTNPLTKDEMIVALLKMTRRPTKQMAKHICELLSKEPRQLGPMFLKDSGKGEGIQVEIRGDSKTVVDWINGKAREREEK